jgi:hypothetical protein
MYARLLGLMMVVLSVVACGSSSSGEAAGSAGGPQSAHSLTLSAKLTPVNGQLPFITAALSVIRIPTTDIVGKPYLIATFPGGFSPGNDPPIHSTWGRVPADLNITYTTPATYGDGPYDMVLVVYATTPISDEVMAKSSQFAPPAVKGDLASFTNDPAAVRSGDPAVALGGLRLNVAGANAAVAITNRTPANESDPAQLAGSFSNTVMIIP